MLTISIVDFFLDELGFAKDSEHFIFKFFLE